MNKLCLIAILLLSPICAWAMNSVGQVISTDSEFSALRNGKTETLQRKSEIFEGDILVTGKTSFAQIRLKDGAIVDLQPATKFEVKHYEYDPNNAKHPVKSELKLLEGGFKTITGVITQYDPSAYSVETDIGTMGVRGTYWGSVSCPADGEYLGLKCKPFSVVMSVWADPEHKKAPEHCGAWIKNSADYKELGPCQACSHVYMASAQSKIKCTLQQSPLFLPRVNDIPAPGEPKNNDGAPIAPEPDQIQFYNTPGDLGLTSLNFNTPFGAVTLGRGLVFTGVASSAALGSPVIADSPALLQSVQQSPGSLSQFGTVDFGSGFVVSAGEWSTQDNAFPAATFQSLGTVNNTGSPVFWITAFPTPQSTLDALSVALPIGTFNTKSAVTGAGIGGFFSSNTKLGSGVFASDQSNMILMINLKTGALQNGSSLSIVGTGQNLVAYQWSSSLGGNLNNMTLLNPSLNSTTFSTKNVTGQIKGVITGPAADAAVGVFSLAATQQGTANTATVSGVFVAAKQ